MNVGPLTAEPAGMGQALPDNATAGMSEAAAQEATWYKDAIIYELHVRAFADSNGDGIGDFPGLIERLDYLQELGVTAIWLLPFYPSPQRDGGYDIADYTSINPDYGTMRDFTRFVREAHRRGLRVITELVVNHTSDQHPWFQRAIAAPKGSPARDWYVFSDTDEALSGTRIIFTDTETSNWAWSTQAGQYYWHRFFGHQPDLNYDNPQVRRAILRVMKFWFDRGVDGMRLDAVPYLVEREGTNNENLPETHAILREWRAFVDERYSGRMLLAEANQWPDDVRAYFGEADECHMAFHFPIMPRLFMSLRQEDRRPIIDILERTPAIPESAQWALFLRNHDELTLEMVTDEERDYMYAIYATDPRMRVNVGIRRRLAPLLDNNRRAIELLHGLLFSLPGTPILYYGDEIGMGDNVFLGDRDGVRTPMQWNGDRNAGFSKADPHRLYLPLVMDPLFGYQAVNVEAQERSPSSLLNWMRRMLALRGRRRAFGRGDMTMLHPDNRTILAFVRRYEGECILVVANLSRFVQPVELDLSAYAGMGMREVIGQQPFPPIDGSPYFLTMAPHAFYWFDLVPEAVEAAPEDLPVLEVEGDWHALLKGAAREALEREVLPAFLARQRWYGEKAEEPAPVRLLDVVPVRDGATPAWLATVTPAREAERAPDGDAADTYLVWLAIASGRAARRLLEDQRPCAIARVRSARGPGLLFEGAASDDVARDALEFLAEGREAQGRGATLRGHPWSGFRSLYEAMDEDAPVTHLNAEQSNTNLRFGSQVMLKLQRRFEPEPHPEVEVGRHLRARPDISPRLVGTIDLQSGAGRGPVALAHEFVWSRGSGWEWLVAACRRFLEDRGAETAPPLSGLDPLALVRSLREPGAADQTAGLVRGPDYAEEVRALGETTARMHLALADARGDAAFEPEALVPGDLRALAERARRRLAGLEPALRRLAATDGLAAEHARALVASAAGLRSWLREAPRLGVTATKTRVHGDYHLGQVLVEEPGFVVLDYGGEVGLPVDVRRQKASPFVDIAGMLRSLGYASVSGRSTEELSHPDVEPAVQRLAQWAAWWEEQATAAFLDAYLQTAGDASFIPADPAEQSLLLQLHLLDKALHEVEYELAYRPDWVAIPVEGLARIVAGVLAGEEASP